jgi:hypothetical protein
VRLLIWIGALIALLLIVLIVVLLSEDDASVSASTAGVDETTTSASVTTTPPAASTSSTATTTASTTAPSTTAPSTTAAPAGACSSLVGAAIPGPEPGVSFALGDFDGDGASDQLIGYEDAGGTWWVQMALSYGYATQTAVPGPVTAVGAVAFDGGQDIGYAYVDSGASTQLVGFFFLPGCDVFEVTTDSGGVARFPIGGGVTHLDGLTCVADGLISKSATTDNGSTWEYQTTRWAWVPGLLEFQAVTSSIALLNSPADDAVIFGSGSFDCPDTSL